MLSEDVSFCPQEEVRKATGCRFQKPLRMVRAVDSMTEPHRCFFQLRAERWGPCSGGVGASLPSPLSRPIPASVTHGEAASSSGQTPQRPVSRQSPTLSCQMRVKQRGTEWEVVAEVASEDRSPAGDAQSSAAIEGPGCRGRGLGRWQVWGRGHLATTFRPSVSDKHVSWFGATSSAAGAWID